jgi:peptidoglycan-N-acetylglucosamine deacetylase
MRLVPLLSAALILVCGSAGAAPVAKKTLTAKTATYEITIDYPQVGVKAVDDDMLAWAKTTLAEFRTDSADHQTGERAYDFEVTYHVERNDGKIFAVLFDEYTDMGGAHPNHDYYAANYFMPDGWRIYLPELLDGSRGLKRISDLARTDLDKRITVGTDALSDADTVKGGTTPDWDNFRSFILMPNAIALYYPPYQVASYAAGPQDGHIPLSALRDVMRPDPRKPAASFDCAAARSQVEQTICSDVALARLDRDVAEAYVTHIRNNAAEPNAATAASLKANQRAWLAQRDTVCGPAGAKTACLTDFYKSRIAWLARQP